CFFHVFLARGIDDILEKKMLFKRIVIYPFIKNRDGSDITFSRGEFAYLVKIFPVWIWCNLAQATMILQVFYFLIEKFARLFFNRLDEFVVICEQSFYQGV